MTSRLPPPGTAVPNATLPPWNGKDRLNVLLVGSDTRPDEGINNTDTMIVVSIDPATRRVVLFSLPRDTVDVPLPPGPARAVFGRAYAGKINGLWMQAIARPDLFPGTPTTRGPNALKAALGDLDKITRVVRLGGFINSAAGFADGPKVMNGASDLIVEVFGDRGRHTRFALGLLSLPLEMTVNIEGVFEIAPKRSADARRRTSNKR